MRIAALAIALTLGGCASTYFATPIAAPTVTRKAPPANTAGGLACVMDGRCN